MIAAGIGLAALAACCYALAAVLQHRAVQTVATGALKLSHVGRLVRQPGWLLGTLAVAGGAALHIMSLSMAPLIIIQPIGVLSIGLTTLATAKLTRATLLSVGATGAGVGLFVLIAASRPMNNAVPDLVAGKVLPVTGLVVALLVLAGYSTKGWARCPLFATAAGFAYGAVSVLAKVVASRVRVGGLADLPPLATVFTVVAALIMVGIGAVCVHQAFAVGRPDTVAACQTVTDPLVGVLFGVFLFHESAGLGPAAVLGEIAAGLLATAGVVALARRPESSSPQGKQSMDRPLRIVIGADTYPPDINGAAKFAHQLAGGLAERDYDVHVVCPSDTGRAGESRIDGVTVHRLTAHRTPLHPSFRVCTPWHAQRAASDIVEGLRPDLVHVQAHFTVGRSVLRAAAARDIPVVATNHFMPQNLEHYLRVPDRLSATVGRWAWRDLARVFDDASIVTAPTPTAVRMLRDHGLTGRVVPVSCGVHTERFRTDRPAAGKSILFVGRLDEEKHVDELLRAVALLPDHRVELVGDGACRPALTELARTLGISDRVEFLGFVSDTELVAAYHRAGVFCMPGIAELQSIATMEAMAAGRPIVAADAVALPHLVRPGHNGWLYPPGDVDALAARLAYVTAPGRGARMGAASREMIRIHDVAHSLDTFETLYCIAAGLAQTPQVAELPEVVVPRVSIPAVAVRP